MIETSVIRPLGFEVGPHPRARALNPHFSATVPLLKLGVEVDWRPVDAAEAVFALERQLAALSPSLIRHQCRGHAEYRILRSQSPEAAGPPLFSRGFEAALALAHLLEHLMIDAVAFLTAAPVVSGATAALKVPENRYDIFVECPDPALARLVVGLPVSWLGWILSGRKLDGGGWPALVVARHLYLHEPGPLDPGALARDLALEPEEVRSALAWLEGNGLACGEGYTMNFSGIEYCRLWKFGPAEDSPGAPAGRIPRAPPGDDEPRRSPGTPGRPPSRP